MGYFHFTCILFLAFLLMLLLQRVDSARSYSGSDSDSNELQRSHTSLLSSTSTTLLLPEASREGTKTAVAASLSSMRNGAKEAFERSKEGVQRLFRKVRKSDTGASQPSSSAAGPSSEQNGEGMEQPRLVHQTHGKMQRQMRLQMRRQRWYLSRRHGEHFMSYPMDVRDPHERIRRHRYIKAMASGSEEAMEGPRSRGSSVSSLGLRGSDSRRYWSLSSSEGPSTPRYPSLASLRGSKASVDNEDDALGYSDE